METVQQERSEPKRTGRQGRVANLAAAVHLVAPAIGRKLDVKVCIGGSVAATDGKTIFIPSLPPDDGKASVFAFGYLVHEANHVRETDVTARPADGFAASLWNALEDNRSDGLGFQLYPGARMDRNALITLLEEDGKLNQPKQSDGPARVLEQYCYWRLQHEYLKLTCAEKFAKAAEALAVEMFPAGAITRLDALLWQTPECKNSHDVAALAGRIRAALEEEAQEPPSAPAESNAENAGNEEGASPGDGESGSGGEGGTHSEEAQGGNGDDSEKRAALRAALAEGAEHMEDLGSVVKGALEAYAGEHRGEAVGGAAAEASGGFSPDAGGAIVDRAFDLDVRASSNALLYRIRGLLQAETRTRRVYQASGGRIDGRRLAGTKVGNFNAFVRRVRGLSTNCAVMILVDRSGSTSGRIIEVARESSYALALAMERIDGVAVGAAAFPGVGASGVEPLVRFGESCFRASGRFARLFASGGTPMAESMLWAGSELLSVNRDRRLLLVLTDGAYPGELGRRIVGVLARSGIECGGIGIGVASVSEIFSLSRVILDVSELPGAMFELLFAMLKLGPQRLAA